MASQKITSKNLSYDSSLPPFLAKLHVQAASGADSPDPILAARRRPRGPGRSASEEAEDAPLVLDEHGNAVALKVDDDGEIVTVEEDKSEAESARDREGREEAQKKADAQTSAASFGGSRKRKAGKVVGGGDDEAKEDADRVKSKTSSAKEASSGSKEPEDEPMAKAKPKKKAKKIKLSFDDGE
jgi:hypothetical protein